MRTPNTISILLPNAPACRRWYISFSGSRAPCLSFQHPSVCPGGCCFVVAPGGTRTMVAWLRCYRCVWGFPGPGDLLNSAFWVVPASC